MEKILFPVTVKSDFLQEMIPHHQGALEMANYEIKYGRNHEMVQLAKSIAAEQAAEIQQMRLWLKKMSFNKTKLPEGYRQAMSKTMETTMAHLPANDRLNIM